MKILYCDCFSGISGDMFLAAMLDAGLPLEYLRGELEKLALPEFKGMRTQKVLKGAISATQILFDIDEPHEHAHEHEDDHDHDHSHHHSHSRNLQQILELIASSSLTEPVKQMSAQFFTKLGEAEAKIHGVPLADVHFHEVGAVDSILDMVGAAVALDYFGVERVYSTPVPLGTGSVETQHGLMPLPAPATLALLNAAHAKVTPSPAQKELVTPTGAAILATLATFAQPDMTLTHTGLGAGKHDLPWPNVLRLMLGEQANPQTDYVEINTNIDDMNPQFYAPVMQHLFDAGALDVTLTPIQMKKNRPGVQVCVIARQETEEALSQILLRETSTLGVRVSQIWRHEAVREMRGLETRWGTLPIKVKRLDGRIIQATPEFDDCLRVAQAHQLPVADVFREVQAAAAQWIE
ncbi:MAG: nickel pincer cofactor biosynthesis protein LarC [Anaerolineaceae bacterium]|nr:nickel pincer cofactor biosynthesis protein LarC [Anaerolineaceae bacterium]